MVSPEEAWKSWEAAFQARQSPVTNTLPANIQSEGSPLLAAIGSPKVEPAKEFIQPSQKTQQIHKGWPKGKKRK